MWKKSSGQEAIEFVLIATLIFLSSLFVTLLFGEKLAAFFKNNATSTEHEVTLVGPEGTASNGGLEDPNATGPGTIVKIPLGDGKTTTITIPDPAFYQQTTGSSGELINVESDYTKALGQLFKKLANDTSNANLNELANLISSDAGLMSILVPTYDTTDPKNPPTALNLLDPASSQFGQQVKNVVASLDTTMGQLKDEASTYGIYSNQFTGLNQDDYAKKIETTLAKVMSDSSLSPEVKNVANTLTKQVQTVADNHSYTFDITTYNDAVPILNQIATVSQSQGDLPAFDVIDSYNMTDGSTGGNDSNVTSPANDTVSDTANSLVSVLGDSANTTAINQLPADSKSKIQNLLDTLKIAINQPLDSAIDTYLAAKVTCVAGGGVWVSASNSCN